MKMRDSFLEVKRPERDVNHSPPSSAERRDNYAIGPFNLKEEDHQENLDADGKATSDLVLKEKYDLCLVQDRDKRLALVNALRHPRVPQNAGNLSTS